ncbi:MAG: Arm DNA-binding domain-containing protein [Devosia sp.]
MERRKLHRLTAAQVRSLTEDGRHADGGGLYLVVTPGGTRNWSFMWKPDKKRREIGLDTFPLGDVG